MGRYHLEQHPHYWSEWQCSPVSGLAGPCFRGMAIDGPLCARPDATAQRATIYRGCAYGGDQKYPHFHTPHFLPPLSTRESRINTENLGGPHLRGRDQTALALASAPPHP